ncbi:MAG: peptidase M14 [Candidatus Anammoximicrobium sp.]|nr:peptidase M14 [Candidatus Anammoximicrobium sp.]
MSLLYARRRWLPPRLVLALVLSGGMSAPAAEVAGEAAKKCFFFPAAGLTLDADFSGGRLNDCTQAAAGRFQVLIRAETTPINNSAWYAFRVRSDQPQTIELELKYEGGTHRYAPKVSRDGRTWTRLTGAAYQPAKGQAPLLRLDVGPEPLWVAAQELLIAEDLYGWARRTATATGAAEREVGRSVAGRPLLAWTLGNADSADHLVFIGRQHPPEVTGSLALMALVDRLTEGDDLAVRFRQRFQVTVIPLVNPDGVELGHWRCNLNRVDLNRDWMKFIQPETRAVRDEIQRLAAAGQTLRLFLDFHSTGHDVFYTQRDSDPMVPPDFTRRWLEAVQQQLPEYRVRREGSAAGKLALAAPWAYRTFRIPAITYEVGDNTPRPLIRTVARAAGETLMRTLLADAAQGRLPAAGGKQNQAAAGG